MWPRQLPFFLTGLLFSVVFARETWRVPRLYGADLSGGALACLAVVPLLNWIGGPNTILAAAIAMAAAAMVWAPSVSARKLAGALAGLFVVLIAANHSNRLIDVIYAKGMFRDRSWVEFARWNALSRVEVDRQGQAKAIVIDADASTYIMNCDLAHWHDTELGARSHVSSAGAGQRSASARGVRDYRAGRRCGRAARSGERQPQRDRN